MNADTQRRDVLRILLAATVAACTPAFAARRTGDGDGAQQLEQLERAVGGRLGVQALDTHSGNSLSWRADERFGMCSTFKLPLAAVILREADSGRLSLDELLPYDEKDMVPHAPVTQVHLARGRLSIGALAEAGQTTSDNVAANLLIRRLGGPAAVTALFRAMGDPITRIDRYEPEMNLVPPGEIRDTTTPRAMAETTARLMSGELLSSGSREKLRGWMVATETGKRRIRAGLSSDWIAGDKTGTAISPRQANKINDVAVAWPPSRAPLVVAAYLEASGYFEEIRPQDERVLAKVGRIVAHWIG